MVQEVLEQFACWVSGKWRGPFGVGINAKRG